MFSGSTPLQHFENTSKLPPLLELFINEAVNHSLEKWREMKKTNVILARIARTRL
jgi:hypothetical protein